MDLEEAENLRKITINITHSQYMTLYSLAALGSLPPDPEHNEFLQEHGLVEKDLDRVCITDRGKLIMRDYRSMTQENLRYIFEYDVELRGIENEQHFAGASNLDWDETSVGIGETAEEAFYDATEGLLTHWDVGTLPDAQASFDGIDLHHPHLDTSVSEYVRAENLDNHDHGLHWYVVVRVK
jgi:hypothetical protein